VTVPAAASVFTGKPAPQTIGAIARGLLAEPYPLAQVNTSRTLATQALLGVVVPVQAGMVISGVAVCIETAAAGADPTGLFLGITDLTGVRLGITADSKAAALWAATGPTSFALTTAYTVTTDGAVYACIVKNGVWAGTEAKIATMTAVTGSGKAFGSNAPLGVTQAGQTTVPTTATWTANDSFPWIALV
jgi:hypothetical protein